MSRNPHKTRCQVPGCRNWAMRGHTHCRPHRDPELGPRGAGVPPGNLNALRTGQHANPLSREELGQLAQAILRAPDRLPHHLDLTIQDIHRRCQDPVKTLAALQALVPALLSRVAEDLFVAELNAFRTQLPPAHQGQFERTVWRHALRLGPVDKLHLLRTLQHRIQRSANPTSTPQHPTPNTQRPTSNTHDD